MLTEQYNYAECKSLNACEVCFDESHTVFLKLKTKNKKLQTSYLPSEGKCTAS